MGVSLKFKNISKNILKLANVILNNPNLIKYIVCLDDNIYPLDYNIEHITAKMVRNNHFVFCQFNKDILSETKILIFVNVLSNSFRGTTLSVDTYVIDIVIPINYWIIDVNNIMEIRGYSIAYEIAKTIDQKNIAGIGNVEITQAKTGIIDNKYAVLSLFVETNNAINSG